jgi:hypothetical protein
LTKLPPQAISNTKRALNLHLERSARGVIEFGLAAEALGHTTPEFQLMANERAEKAAVKNGAAQGTGPRS